MSNTSIIVRSAVNATALHARSLATVYRLTTLEPDLEYETPVSCELLTDTTPKFRQWVASKSYYQQSLRGTDWPDRFVVRFGNEADFSPQSREADL